MLINFSTKIRLGMLINVMFIKKCVRKCCHETTVKAFFVIILLRVQKGPNFLKNFPNFLKPFKAKNINMLLVPFIHWKLRYGKRHERRKVSNCV